MAESALRNLSEWRDPRSAADWGPGSRVAGRYLIEAQIGEGASAVTYRARDELLGRPVALKALRSRFTRDSEEIARFEREARIAAAITHPNVVAVYDFGTDGGAFFIALHYVAGRDLREELDDRGRLTAEESVAVGRAVLAGLGAIHLAGIVHRDIKPSNILMGADGAVRLTDFGVAYEIIADRLTSHGATIGTAAYMAPEQARGSELTSATDLYAVGMVLFEALTGRLPFSHDNPMATLLAQIQTPPPRPRDIAPTANIPIALEQAILHALEKDPANRFPTAASMTQALVNATEPTTIPAATTKLPSVPRALGAPSPIGQLTHSGVVQSSSKSQSPGGRFQPSHGWSGAAQSVTAREKLRPWLTAAGAAVVALSILTTTLLSDIAGGGKGGDDSDRTQPGAVGSAPTPTAISMAAGSTSDAAVSAPTESPGRPTAIAVSTRRPVATRTPAPTEAPTEEPTDRPTETPEPTAESTETKEPPTPTDEPEPTPTLKSTATKEPTFDAQSGDSVDSIESRVSDLNHAIGSGGAAVGVANTVAFEANAWFGGRFDEDEFGRPAVVLTGRGSAGSAATLTFEITSVPSAGLLVRLELFAPESGLGDDFQVGVNDMAFGLASGPSGIRPIAGWTLIEVEVPASVLTTGSNVITVRYDAPAGRAGRDAAIGLGGGEIEPLVSTSATNQPGLGQASTSSSGASTFDDTESTTNNRNAVQNESGPSAAPTIAPR